MSLFGHKTEITLEIDSPTVIAGDPVRARVTFGAPDSKTEGARIELLYRNTYRHSTRGHDGVQQPTTAHSEVVVATQPVDVPESGLASPVETTFTIPGDAPGSATKTVEWQLRAIIERKHGRDAIAEQPLTVLSPATGLAEWAQTPAEPSVSWPIAVEASTRSLRPGERIAGHLSFTPAETIKAAGVRVQLMRRLNGQDGNFERNDKTRVELIGKTELAAGMPQSLPFEIAVPGDASPSFNAANNDQHWYLEGIIDVSHSTDPHVSVEIVVHTG